MKGKEGNETIFTDNPNLEYARNNEDLVFAQCRQRVGFTEKYETTGFNKINLYCFRGYFYTRALKKVGDQTAMAMMGWGAYLSQYQRRTDEEKEELWDEIEPEILIYDLTKKDNQIKELKKANSKIDDLSKTVEEVKEQQFKTQDALDTLLQAASGKEWGWSDEDVNRVWEIFNTKFHEILDEAKKSGSKQL